MRRRSNWIFKQRSRSILLGVANKDVILVSAVAEWQPLVIDGWPTGSIINFGRQFNFTVVGMYVPMGCTRCSVNPIYAQD